MIHVAFLQSDPLNRIQAGIKTIECRLGKVKPLAWTAQVGDTLLLKRVGGQIELLTTIAEVHHFANLTPDDVLAFGEMVQPFIGTTNLDYFVAKQHARYAVALELSAITPCSYPVHLTPKGVQSGWVRDFRADVAAICFR